MKELTSVVLLCSFNEDIHIDALFRNTSFFLYHGLYLEYRYLGYTEIADDVYYLFRSVLTGIIYPFTFDFLLRNDFTYLEPKRGFFNDFLKLLTCDCGYDTSRGFVRVGRYRKVSRR